MLADVAVNCGTVGGDMFQKFIFEKINTIGEKKSIYSDEFGEKSSLYPVLYGLKSVVKDVISDVDFNILVAPAAKTVSKDYFLTRGSSPESRTFSSEIDPF